jgi:hypothetical protein
MRLVLPLVLLCILSPTTGRAALIPVSAETQIEPATSFTTLELWNSTTPTSVDVGGVVVSYQMIDSEKAKRGSVVGASPIQLRRQLCGLVTDPNIERVGRYGGWKTNWSNPNRCGEARSMSNRILALCFNGQRGVRPCTPTFDHSR